MVGITVLFRLWAVSPLWTTVANHAYMDSEIVARSIACNGNIMNSDNSLELALLLCTIYL